jgi:hypothetical protein
MSNIPRYRMISSLGHQAIGGTWVRYEDHTVAVEAAVLAENIRLGGIVKQPHEIADRITPPTTCGCPGGYAKQAPTPAELIPTLKEHEWVRGTYKATGIAFGPCTVYLNEIGAMFAGDNNLIHWNTGAISGELATLERCEAPVVK